MSNTKASTPVFHLLVYIVFFGILSIVFTPNSGAELTKFKAEPDRVLVLFNADYTVDIDGSLPGQDSEEVARYYVEQHTDVRTGKKPFILGLKCQHPRKKHLNQWVIKEKSNDNKNGIVYKGHGKGPGVKEWPKDSRFIEFIVEKKDKTVDWASLKIFLEARNTKKKVKISPEVTGIPIREGRRVVYPEVEEGKGRCYRFNGKQIFKGTVQVQVSVRDITGKQINYPTVTYYDHEEFEFSALGRDNISDELHFQEDIAIPVKKFLEADRNRLPDGRLLKDYILYIVVCHGLPFSCEGVFGIERGARLNPKDQGDLASLEQRLQTLYYGWGKEIRPPVISLPIPGLLNSDKRIHSRILTTPMRYSLSGQRWQPYMHPDTYSFLGGKKDASHLDLPPLEDKRKKLPPYLFAYGVSRLDGQGPFEAKRQIDYSLYASKYLRPEMDIKVRKAAKKKRLDAKLTRVVSINVWGSSEEQELGFRVLSSYNGQGVPFLGRPLEDFDEKSAPKKERQIKNGWMGYYPGGMDRTVVSSNGWNMGRKASIWEHVDHGITISACGGPAYGGGPHITNTTFWDNRILLRYLFRGRDLGESFLLSTYYVNWSTSLIGDPLYHPDLSRTIVDETPPRVVSKNAIQLKLTPAMGKFAGQLIVPIISTKETPELSTLSVYYGKEGRPKEMVSRWPIYSTRPRVILRELEPRSKYVYRPVLRDPYGNETDLSLSLGPLSFDTGDIPDDLPVVRRGKLKKNGWSIELLKRRMFSESGTFEIVYSSTKDGAFPVIRSKDIEIGAMSGHSSSPFKIGGPSRGWIKKKKTPVPKGADITMIVRWRRFPLTRELLFRTRNGQEFTYAADVRTPWETMYLRGPITIKPVSGVDIHSVKLYSDALPASEAANSIKVAPLDLASWQISHQ